MAVSPLVTPKVAGIHYNDLTQQWHLHMSRQEKTGLGVFQEMDKETFMSLAELIVALLNFWALVGELRTGTLINAPLGSLAEIGAAVTAQGVLDVSLAATPVAATGPTDLDPGVGDYDGAADSWGATPVGP